VAGNGGPLIDYHASNFQTDVFRPNTSSGPSKGTASLNPQRTRSQAMAWNHNNQGMRSLNAPLSQVARKSQSGLMSGPISNTRLMSKLDMKKSFYSRNNPISNTATIGIRYKNRNPNLQVMSQ
jgi:hypothetical protein